MSIQALNPETPISQTHEVSALETAATPVDWLEASAGTAVTADFSVADMALYNLDRARAALQRLEDKPRWEASDTTSFDCMHYLGDAAIARAARALALTAGAHVVDIGAGFGATGRYLHAHYGVDVTGVELQADIHGMAQLIAVRNGVQEHVRSLNADFLTLEPTRDLHRPADYLVSFLCFLHISDRARLFAKAASALPPGGRMYIEDFYARATLSATEQAQLRDVVSCPYLPDQARYEADLREAGFDAISFEDVSAQWTVFVGERAAAYHASANPSPSLDFFYGTVASLFGGGHLGGARILCERR
jgi:SAM-dependent methyltransferase